MNEWISVKDKLPEFKKEVLVYCYLNNIDKGQYVAWIENLGMKNKPIWQYSTCCGCYVPYEVTHWRELLPDPLENKNE